MNVKRKISDKKKSRGFVVTPINSDFADDLDYIKKNHSLKKNALIIRESVRVFRNKLQKGEL